MTNLLKWQRRSKTPERWQSLDFNELNSLFGQFSYQGLGYGSGIMTTMNPNTEEIQRDFEGFVAGAYQSSGPVFALIMTRMLVFAQARFQFRQSNRGRPGKLFGNDDLKVIERPDKNVTTYDLLARALLDVDLAGNWFGTIVRDSSAPAGRRLVRLRPDWVTIVKGSIDNPQISPYDPSAELVGYVYQPGGPGSGYPMKSYLPNEVAHFAPLPDPSANYRGMSWVLPIIQEILGDKAMMTHKLMFFENGASPNMVISMDTGKMDVKSFQEWVDQFELQNNGSFNAYKSLYLGQGATATVVGANLKELEYHSVMGQGETRLAAAAGVPPMLAGFSEGLQALTLQNFQMARRLFADRTLRALWQNFAGSLSSIINVPGGCELWYDDRDIPFLQDDAKDAADILQTRATAINQLVMAGYTPESVVNAVETNDLTLLEHSGMFSVQLHPPGVHPPDEDNGGDSDSDTSTQSNGNGNGDNDNLASKDLRGILNRHRNHPERIPHVLAQALKTAKAGE